MSASNQPPRSVNFPSLLVSEDDGTLAPPSEAQATEPSIHTWIDSEFVPSWLRPFSLGATTRFTRTPDHLLRKGGEPEDHGPGYCIGGAGWHFLDMPPDGDEDLSAFPSLKADLDALEMAFSDMQGAARLVVEDSMGADAAALEPEIGPEPAADGSFVVEAGVIASFVSQELGADFEEDSMAMPAFPQEAWLEDEAADVAHEVDVVEAEATAPALEPAPDEALDDLPSGMVPALPVGEDAEVASVHAPMVPFTDVIGPQMAASWAEDQAGRAGPPAHLLVLREAILLGDADFIHRSAADQDLHALPLMEEDAGVDAVMLSDWDVSLPAEAGEDADVAVMLSDVESAIELESGAEILVADEGEIEDATAGLVLAASAPASGTVADDVMAEDMASEIMVSAVAPVVSDVETADEAADFETSFWEDAVLADTGADDLQVPPAPEYPAAPVGVTPAVDVGEDAPVGDLPPIAAEPQEIAAQVPAGEDAGAMDMLEAAAADEVGHVELPVVEAAIAEDDDIGETVQVVASAMPAPVAEMRDEPAVPARPAVPDSLMPAAAAFTAPVIGVAFQWQPYQHGISSDLMRFAAPAAPSMPVAPVVQSAPAPAPLAAPVQVQAEDVVHAFSGYQLPDLELLSEPPQLEPDYELSEEFLDQNSTALQQILRDFGVRGEVIDANPGPVVTLYEFEPAPGVKSSRVIGLADDIARSMSAISARVAVVPGRNVIGIELPNRRRDTVWLRELLSSQEFGEARTKLGIGLGKTIGGEPVIADLARMPHLLVAGTTGSGKSVAINTMILSLLYQHTPEQCRLIMIDPKMLELSIYEGIPHLLTPVVTDPKKAIIALKWAVKEMEDRYRKMARLAVRNIDGFNARMAEARAKGEVITRQVQVGFDKESGEALFEEQEMDLSPLPYIVIIVDEMADLMMVAGKEIEGAIQRLAQMARAAGIHLVMATQRPSVDVITGTIKANFPTRISFQVTSKIDSRTILGEMGAETLLGQGDMLFMAGGGRIQRVHGPFVSDAEVEHVVDFLKTQGGPEYLDEVVTDEDADGPADGDEPAVFDKGALGETSGDLYDQAVAIVMRDRKASTSYIQRRLQVGYNKAASLMERMEAEGIVGPANHAGKREILAFSRGD